MTIINHVTTGALVAVAIDKPAIALPAALLSHFVLDAVPHWDYKFKNVFHKQAAIMIDMTLTLWLLVVLAASFHASARLIIAGGFLGILPDAVWLPEIVQGKPIPMNRKTPLHYLRRLNAWFQWSESPNGKYVEIAWFIATLSLLVLVLR